MKKYLHFLLVSATLFSLTASADTSTTGGSRYVENPTSNGSLVLRIKDGATKRDAVTVASAGTVAIDGGPNNGVFVLRNAATGTAPGNGLEVAVNAAGTSAWLWNYENTPLRFATNNVEYGSIGTDGVWVLNKGVEVGGSTAMDASSPTISSVRVGVANNDTYALAGNALLLGMLYVINTTSGNVCTFNLRGGNAQSNMMDDPVGVCSHTLGTASRTNVQWNGTAYVVENKNGAAQSYSLMFIGTTGI